MEKTNPSLFFVEGEAPARQDSKGHIALHVDKLFC